MTGSVKRVESQGSHHVTGHNPKHSVEVNVRIKRAKGEQQPTPAPPISSSTPDPELSRAINASLRQRSWADMLHRINVVPSEKNKSTDVPTVPEKPFDEKLRRGIGRGTQTEDVEEAEAGNSKDDYIQTIQELHHLSLKLKADVNRARMAKEQMAANLLGIIEEKDRVIASLKAQPPLPVSASTQSPAFEEPGATESELNQFRSVIRDMKNLCYDEMEAMKNRRISLPPADPRLEKFLTHRSLAPGEVNGNDIGGGGDDGHGEAENDNSSHSEGEVGHGGGGGGTSSSGSSQAGEKELDNNSTQYLDLPKR